MLNKFFKEKRKLFFSLIFFGLIFFFFDLGSTGLIDETPPLFASAGREMSQSGDWLTPKVNGIFRFDKPPLYYWFSAIFYSLPGNQVWDELGSLSARLPSALSAFGLMLLIADTIFTSTKHANQKSHL